MEDAYTVWGRWYEPDWNQAVAVLRTEYEDWKGRGGVQSPMGEAAAAWLRGRRQWSQTRDALLGLIELYESTQRFKTNLNE